MKYLLFEILLARRHLNIGNGEILRWPYFPMDFVLNHRDTITNLYYVYHKRGFNLMESDRYFCHGMFLDGKIKRLSNIADLEEHVIDDIEGCADEENYSILVETGDWDTIMSFCRLFPEHGKLTDFVSDRLALEDMLAFEQFLESFPPNTVLFGFAEEARHMGIFGSQSLLERVCVEHDRYLNDIKSRFPQLPVVEIPEGRGLISSLRFLWSHFRPQKSR